MGTPGRPANRPVFPDSKVAKKVYCQYRYTSRILLVMEKEIANVTVRVYESDRDELNALAKSIKRGAVADVIRNLLRPKKRRPKEDQ